MLPTRVRSSRGGQGDVRAWLLARPDVHLASPYLGFLSVDGERVAVHCPTALIGRGRTGLTFVVRTPAPRALWGARFVPHVEDAPRFALIT